MSIIPLCIFLINLILCIISFILEYTKNKKFPCGWFCACCGWTSAAIVWFGLK